MSEKYVKPVFDIQGWMNDEELQWLYTQARRMESIVEIGCWRGRSTHALLSGCPGIVNAVDHWKGSPDERAAGQPHHDAMSQDIYAQFMANVGQFPNLKVFRMESGDAADQIAEAQMVFIDATHRAADVARDILLWESKAKRLLCGHDYTLIGVKEAVDRLLFRTVQHVPGTSLWYVEVD